MTKFWSAAKVIFYPFAFLLVIGYWLQSSCVKPPNYPKEPVIEFKSMSKTQLRQGNKGEDSLTITFTYTDGDGDLGFPESESQSSIFVQDGRDSFERYPYKIPYVEPQGTGNGISGEISIVVPTSCCIYTNPQGFKLSCDKVPQDFKFDTLLYWITIKDRAGHRSNRISTPAITLRCWE
jgi:hypothetical protein